MGARLSGVRIRSGKNIKVKEQGEQAYPTNCSDCGNSFSLNFEPHAGRVYVCKDCYEVRMKSSRVEDGHMLACVECGKEGFSAGFRLDFRCEGCRKKHVSHNNTKVLTGVTCPACGKRHYITTAGSQYLGNVQEMYPKQSRSKSIIIIVKPIDFIIV